MNEEMMEKMKAGGDPMAMCPMAAMCKGMMAQKTAGFGFLLMIPGALLVVLGVLVVIEPKILIWLVAATLVILGLGMIMIVNSLRRLGARFGSTDDQIEQRP